MSNRAVRIDNGSRGLGPSRSGIAGRIPSKQVVADTYKTCVQELYRLGHELADTSVPFELEHMRVLCRALGSPERRFPSVLIAGTNGKGSTAAMLGSVVATSGYRTGLYTSPHLLRANERIRVNGRAISDEQFAQAFAIVNDCALKLVADGWLPRHPSFFECMTAMAFIHFASELVDIAVLEVGLGGRLDATNVVDPLVSVITDIGLDHQDLLGNTLEAITREKAGIVRSGCPAIWLPQVPAVSIALYQTIESKYALNCSAQPYLSALIDQRDSSGAEMVPGELLMALQHGLKIVPPLPGKHQMRNLALALATCDKLRTHGFAVNVGRAAIGVAATHWPGRFQVLPADPSISRPEIVLDSAHNPAGAATLRDTLQERYRGREVVLVFGAMRDKAIQEMSKTLFPLASSIVLTQSRSNPRAATVSELRALTQPTEAIVCGVPDLARALELAQVEALRRGNQALVVIAGSIYVLSDVMRELGVRV